MSEASESDTERRHESKNRAEAGTVLPFWFRPVFWRKAINSASGLISVCGMGRGVLKGLVVEV